ncbi:MAG: hypothetical protein WKG32_06825 [Gemmatimonadaceae bacterium]
MSATILALLALAPTLASPAAAQGRGAGAARTSPPRAAAALPIPPAREFAHHETIWMGYHEGSGYGTVELRPMPLRAEPLATLGAMYVYRGDRLTEPPAQVSVALRMRSSAARYAAARAIGFVTEEGRPPVSAGPVVRQVADSAGTVIETLAVRMPVADFLRVVNAPRVAVRVAGSDLSLDGERLEALRDFASRMAPTAFERARSTARAAVDTQGLAVRKDSYDPTEVDERAAPAAMQEKPRYPVLPTGDQRVRTILVEYVVDTLGHVEMATLRGRGADAVADAPFVDAVRAVAARWEFTPARKNGRPVRQVVRQALLFEPR